LTLKKNTILNFFYYKHIIETPTRGQTRTNLTFRKKGN